MPTEPRHRRPAGCAWLVVAVIAGLLVGAWFTRNHVIASSQCTATANGESYQLDSEQARNAATITAIADRRGLPARAASIAIATAMQESKLRNIDYGDRDSLGLFQQRPSQGWGTPTQIMDPVYSTNAFYDALVKIKGYETMVITEVAQKVQRSAFPDAYAFHEPTARAFASALAGHSPAGLTCQLPTLDEAAEQAGAGGLTGRAATVRAALEKEAGVSASAGDRPTTLVVSAPDTRQAWAVAEWAVAGADDLKITTVTVADQRWNRGRDDAWAPASGNAGTRVSITVS